MTRSVMFKHLKALDFSLLIAPLILSATSIALIFSLVFSSADASLAFRQAVFVGLGIIAMFVFALVDYRSFRGTWWIFYLVSVLLLVYVEIFGFVSGGAARWIDLGFFKLQPSEIAKIGVIITLASYFSGKIGRSSILNYIVSGVLTLVPLILVLREPDLGSGLVLVFIFVLTIILSKPDIKKSIIFTTMIAAFLLVFVLAVANVAPFGGLLKDYQRNRVMTFVDPDLDPYGQGYNVRQAQITLGSGGMFGQGLGRGSQSQLKFLPKPHTDFIFAGAGEALGFVGSFVIVLIYLYMIIRILVIAGKARDDFGMFIALGIGAMFLFQVCINIGMNLGLTPVTGIPLPFLSYGGSSMMVSFISLGIIQSIYIRHKRLSF